MREEFAKLAQEPRQHDGLGIFYPRIARAMKREGMSTFGDLWKKVEALQAEPGVRAVLGSVCYENLHMTISRNTERSPFSRTSYRYNAAAQYVSMALGREEEDLFGSFPTPSAVKGYNGKAAVTVLDEYLRPFTGDPVNDDLSEAIREAFLILRPREREVLEMRCGFGGPRLTLEQIGEHFGVTRNRIRTIEAKALTKLRRPAQADMIAGAIGCTAAGLSQPGL